MIDDLQRVLHTEIPLTRAIGIEVREYSGRALSLTAPLDNNINHKCTAFGGSLYSVAVLTGWGLIHLLLKQQGLAAHIVIQQSQTEFLQPVTSDIVSHCMFESQQQTERLIQMYGRKGRARIDLQTHILCNDDIAVRFSGRYVIHR